MAEAPLREELVALSAIYGDEFTLQCPSSFTVALPSFITARFNLPLSYPHAPPDVHLDTAASSLTADQVRRVLEEVHRAVMGAAGGECCYQIIEGMRNVIEQAEEDRRVEDGLGKEDGHGVNHSSDAEVDEAEDSEEEGRHNKQQPVAQSATPTPLPSEEVLPLSSGPPYTDRRSVFVAHVASLHAPSEIAPLLAALRSHPRLSRATHHMYAYRLSSPSYTQSGCDDDGEDRAGGRLLHLLEAMGCVNVLVCVSRWYGGVKLGADRFRIINDVARRQLEQCGYAGDRRAEGGGGKGKARKAKTARD